MNDLSQVTNVKKKKKLQLLSIILPAVLRCGRLGLPWLTLDSFLQKKNKTLRSIMVISKPQLSELYFFMIVRYGQKKN